MPTRTGTGDLKKAVQSIAGNGEDFEILLRVDDDDRPRQELAASLAQSLPIRIVTGPRGKGYNSMPTFIRELVDVADSQWCWLFDDDAWVEGDWYSPLSNIECDDAKGPAINAEFYSLGTSIYRNTVHGEPCGVIAPTTFVRSFEQPLPVDQGWVDEARKRGWLFWQLEGVFYHHDGRAR